MANQPGEAGEPQTITSGVIYCPYCGQIKEVWTEWETWHGQFPGPVLVECDCGENYHLKAVNIAEYEGGRIYDYQTKPLPSVAPT